MCCPNAREAGEILRLIGEHAARLGIGVGAAPFPTEEELWNVFAPGRFVGAVVGYGDVKGFLCARRIREEDGGCRVILLDDTDRYAIRGLRIHLTDYLVRPVEESRLRAAIRRMLT